MQELKKGNGVGGAKKSSRESPLIELFSCSFSNVDSRFSFLFRSNQLEHRINQFSWLAKPFWDQRQLPVAYLPSASSSFAMANPSCGQSWKDYVDQDLTSAVQSWCDVMARKNQKKRKYCDDSIYHGQSLRDFLLLNPLDSDSSDNEEIENHIVSDMLVKANMRGKQVFQPACITSKCKPFDFYNYPDPWHWVNQDFDYGHYHYHNVDDSFAMNLEVADLENNLLARVKHVPSLHCHGSGSPRDRSLCAKFPELVRKDVEWGGGPFHLVYMVDSSKQSLVQEKEFMGRPISRQVRDAARDSAGTLNGLHQNVAFFNYASLGLKFRHSLVLKAPFPE